jgi:tetratricopeptide (TPR) repeat protein
MSDVFISYSRLDKEFVSQLREALINQAQDVWIDWEDIPPSQSWWNEIQKGIAKANNFVLIMSPNSLSSPICHMEIEYARHLKKRIIPVMHADYKRDECLENITKRLDVVQETTTREIWGSRLPGDVFDANDADLKHINYFFFKPDADFKTRFDELFAVIRTDYEHKEQHTTLLLRAREWDRRARDASFLLIDNELAQAKTWLAASPNKEPAPTELHQIYIQASEQRTRQLHRIRQASIIGSVIAVLALIFAIGASAIGFQASNAANTARTQVANANSDLATATRIAEQALQGEATLRAVNTQVAVVMVTVTEAAVLQDITGSFADAMLQRDYPDDQIAIMNDLVARYPDNVAAYHQRGIIHDEQKNEEAAIADYNEALRLAPNSMIIYYNRAIAYTKLGDVDKAIADYTETLRLEPDYISAYNNRGLLYKNQGRYEEAITDYTEAIRRNPDFVLAYRNRGEVYILQEKYQEALDDYNEVLRINPESSAGYNGRGYVYFILDKNDEALADYNQALRLDPENADAYSNRGVYYQGQGNFEQALADYTEAIRLAPDFASAYNNRGYIYFVLGDYEQAIADYTEALQLDPEEKHTYANRGDAYYSLQDYEHAIADYTEVIRLAPGLADAYNTRGYTYYLNEQYDEAIADFSEAIRLAPEFSKPYVNRGDAYYDLGDYEHSLADYTEALRLLPGDASLYNGRGYDYYMLGDYDKALSDYGKAIELEPDEPNYFDSRCELYLKTGQWALGVADCDKVLLLSPDWEFTDEVQSLLEEARQKVMPPTATTSP